MGDSCVCIYTAKVEWRESPSCKLCSIKRHLETHCHLYNTAKDSQTVKPKLRAFTGPCIADQKECPDAESCYTFYLSDESIFYHPFISNALKWQYSQILWCHTSTKLTPHTPSASPTLEAAVKTAGLVISHLQTKLSGALLDFNFLILVFLPWLSACSCSLTHHYLVIHSGIVTDAMLSV